MTTMTGVFLANNFKAVVPEEVASLIYKFSDVCDDDDGSHILTALWFSLLAALMAANECSPMEAMDHAQDLIKWTKLGTREVAMAALNPLH